MRKRGFTLLELLTVIAIIAILAAIIFPVFARARDSAYKSGDTAQMNTLGTALNLYRVDQGGYPPALLGYVNTYSDGGGSLLPADRIQGFLYPRRERSINTFRPAYVRVGALETTQAVYPSADPRAVGSAPLLDINGDGAVTNADDVAGARQAYGPADGPVCGYRPGVGSGAGHVVGQNGCTAGDVALFYRISGFDVATVPVAGGGNRTELRYALFWSSFGLGSGSAQDDPRQLGYAEPPEDTVVLWNSNFRSYTDGVPNREKRDIVLFLGGSAVTFDSRDMSERSWRVLP